MNSRLYTSNHNWFSLLTPALNEIDKINCSLQGWGQQLILLHPGA